MNIDSIAGKTSAGAVGFVVRYLDSAEAPIVLYQKWFDRTGHDPAGLFAIKVVNDSMEPRLHRGDTVVLNISLTEPKEGVAFGATCNGKFIIGRVVREAGQLWLSPDNPDQRRYLRKRLGTETRLLGEIVHWRSDRI